jgi:DNA topoisomerase-1
VKWGETFISIPKGEDPLSVNQERAEEIINEKKEPMRRLPLTKVNL